VDHSLNYTELNFSNHKRQQLRLSVFTERHASVLVHLVQTDIPARLLQFRAAIEADSVVTKRLYLVKCEYRAPFRAFLEAHQSVLRAPSVELVDEYLTLSKTKNSKRRMSAKEELTVELENPEFIEALALEQKCEGYEIEMAHALFSFCELARFLEHKRARIKEIDTILDEDDVADLQELIRRLKGLLCRKAGYETSTGIRPLLLDLQGVPRDEEPKASGGTDRDFVLRKLNTLAEQLYVLSKLVVTKNAFHTDRRTDVDIPSSIVRGCTSFDNELFQCYFQDWYTLVKRQKELTSKTDFSQLAEKLRRAEMQMSLAVAPVESLEVVRQRVESIASDRAKRFEILNEMIHEVCLREMNLHVKVISPERTKPLLLRPTSALGIFGVPLQIRGESLPIG
jgi:hypothetical protein